MQSIPQERFIRDRMTWLGYLLMGMSNFIFASLGPLMPFMRSEMGLSMTMAALHFSVYSAGSLFAGFYGDRFVRLFGRDRIIWTCALTMCCYLSVLICVPIAYCTIASTFFAGVAGSVNGICFNSLMSNRFGKERTIGITESNIFASLIACAAPLVVGMTSRIGDGYWRITLCLPILLYGMLFLLFRSDSTTKYPADPAIKPGEAKLPLAYWAYWLVIVLNVGCEWSMVLWSAEFLEHIGKLARSDAASGVSAFLGAMLIGRLIGRKLSARFSTQRLLPWAAAVAMTGFLCFWLGRNPIVNIAGLMCTGLGISNFYPLTLAAAISTVPENATTATARMSIGTGAAVLVAPLLLGCVADHWGVFAGYGVVAILLFFCSAMVFVANRQARLHEAQRLGLAGVNGSAVFSHR